MKIQEAQQDLTTWLYRHGKDSPSVPDLLKDYIHLLRDKYMLPVDRIFFATHLVHPQAVSKGGMDSAWLCWLYLFVDGMDGFLFPLSTTCS